MKLKIPSTSVEYLLAEVTSPSEIEITWPVALAVIPTSQKKPLPADWHTAEWQGQAARMLIGPGTSLELDCGVYEVWVKVSAAPEDAVRRAGSLEII